MEKRLYRSQKDRVLGGVCGGLAEYFNIDPTLIRLLFVLAVLFGGGGGIVYLVMWLITPEAPLEAPTAAPPAPVPDQDEGQAES